MTTNRDLLHTFRTSAKILWVTDKVLAYQCTQFSPHLKHTHSVVETSEYACGNY